MHCQEPILTIKELFSTHFGVYKKTIRDGKNGEKMAAEKIENECSIKKRGKNVL